MVDGFQNAPGGSIGCFDSFLDGRAAVAAVVADDATFISALEMPLEDDRRKDGKLLPPLPGLRSNDVFFLPREEDDDFSLRVFGSGSASMTSSSSLLISSSGMRLPLLLCFIVTSSEERRVAC